MTVPFSVLSTFESKPHEIKMVFNVDKGELGKAPRFDIAKGLTDRQSAVDIYRYFGQQPYRTEEEPPSGIQERVGPGNGNLRDRPISSGSLPLAAFFIFPSFRREEG